VFRLPLLSQQYLIDKVEREPLVREDSRCKDYLIEALKFHLMRDEQKQVCMSVISLDFFQIESFVLTVVKIVNLNIIVI